jgi:hypothetical protein
MAALCSGGGHVVVAADRDVDAVWEEGYTPTTVQHDAAWRWGRGREGTHRQWRSMMRRGDGDVGQGTMDDIVVSVAMGWRTGTLGSGDIGQRTGNPK